MNNPEIVKNPYIVGNPIKSKSMFFGRDEDFKFIKKKFTGTNSGLILTLAGDRRSGKTSILFQILRGRLGEEFQPFFVDMQAMPDVDSKQFFEKLDRIIRVALPFQLAPTNYDKNLFDEFEKLIISIKLKKPKIKILMLVDEYELLEEKVEKGKIDKEIIDFLASLLENHNIFFIFTGSRKLEARNSIVWKSLFGKSIYKKITFLRKQDCMNLITKPCSGFIKYSTNQLDWIYHLTSGQPFYTQIFCQNILDKLISESRVNVTDEDIKYVLKDIINNPMPQMIYFWQELTTNQKVTLSAIAHISDENMKSDWGSFYFVADDLYSFLKKMKLAKLITLRDIKTAIEELYHMDILGKEEELLTFRIDIFRYWIKQEQSIWKIISDNKLDKKHKFVSSLFRIIVSVLIIITLGLYFISFRGNRAKDYEPENKYTGVYSNADIELYNDAQYCFEIESYVKSDSLLKRLISRNPSFIEGLILQGDIKMYSNEFTEAKIIYNSILEELSSEKGQYNETIIEEKRTIIAFRLNFLNRIKEPQNQEEIVDQFFRNHPNKKEAFYNEFKRIYEVEDTELANIIRNGLDSYKSQLIKIFRMECASEEIYGEVTFKVFIDEKGRVDEINIYPSEGSHYTDSFITNAKIAMKNWRFENKQAVSYEYSINFHQ